MSTAMRSGLRGGALLGAMLLLTSCGEKGPPRQSVLPRVEMTGVATAGPATGDGEYVTEASARGSAGRPRTAVGSSAAQRYAVSLTDLTGPYVLTALIHGSEQDARLYSLAVEQGSANITPLTHLLFAQVFGQDPAVAFQTFGPGGADPARITAENLQVARTRLLAFIEEQLDLAIPAGLGDFITAPFQPAAGDAMYQAIVDLSARLQSLDLTLDAFTTQVAQAARLCLAERLAVTSGGNGAEFCPQTKSATLSEDETRVEYRFTDRHGNTLAVSVTGDTVLSVRYENTDDESWTCEGAACDALTLDPPAEDETRLMRFAALELSGAAGEMTFNGTLTGAIPGVELPVLPCDSNRYFMVFADRSVVGTCVNTDPYGLGMTALLGNLLGVAPSRMQYDFDAVDGDPTRPRLSILTDANDALLAVQFFDYEPDSYTPRRTFACNLAECNGVTLGPVTANTDILGSDPPILIRTVTLQNTTLKAYDADGHQTGETAALSASVNTGYFDWVAAFFVPPIEFPVPGSCPSRYQEIAALAGATSFDLCLPQTGTALLQDNGDVVLVAGNFETDGLRILLRAGTVAQASIRILNQPLVFLCQDDCAGVSVSQPDANGLRTLHFNNPLLHERFLDVLTGPRTLRPDGGAVVFDAQIPQP